MQLTAEEKKLLLDALSGLKENIKKRILECLIPHIETNTWFRETLFSALKNGVVVKTSPTIEVSGAHGTNALYLHSRRTLEFTEGLMNFCPIVLKLMRHEITHADDFRRADTSLASSVKVQFDYLRIANAIFNQVNYIATTSRLDLDTLRRLKPFLHEAQEGAKSVATILPSSPVFAHPISTHPESYSPPMYFRGFNTPWGVAQYVLSTLWERANIRLYEVTFDPVLALNNSSPLTNNELRSLASKPSDFFESARFLRALSEEDRRVLAAVYSLALALLYNLQSQNEPCFIQMQTDHLMARDFLLKVFECQLSIDPKLAATNLLETHAHIQQQADAQGFSPQLIEYLSPARTSTEISLRKDALLQQEKILEALQAKFMAYFSSSPSSISTQQIILESAFLSAGYSFNSELFMAYAKHQHYSKNQILIGELIVGLLMKSLCCYALAKDDTHIFYNLALSTLISRLCEKISIAFYMALLLQTQTQGVSTVAASLVSSMLGSWVGAFSARSLSNFWGLTEPSPTNAAASAAAEVPASPEGRSVYATITGVAASIGGRLGTLFGRSTPNNPDLQRPELSSPPATTSSLVSPIKISESPPAAALARRR